MEEKRKGKVVLRSSSPVLKIVVIVLIVFSMTALVALHWVHTSIRDETEKMRAEAAALVQENADLDEKIENVDSVESVRDIAQNELGLANPDTVVINVETVPPTE